MCCTQGFAIPSFFQATSDTVSASACAPFRGSSTWAIHCVGAWGRYSQGHGCFGSVGGWVGRAQQCGVPVPPKERARE